MKKIVFITGATAGIGLACAEKFAANGYNVVITGRRKERLAEVKQQLESLYPIQVFTLHFDVQVREAVNAAIATLPEDWNIDVLINNAGLALGRDSFDKADIDDWETMLHTNVDGLLYVTRAILPRMIERKKGHIINLGSIAGKDIYENGNVYCASKAAVDMLSKAMRVDLLKHSLKVTAVHPGAVETEFSLVRFKGNSDQVHAAYEGYKPLSAGDVAETIYYCANLPNHICINELEMTCIQQAGVYYFNKDAKAI